MISLALAAIMYSPQPEPGRLFIAGGGSTPDAVADRFIEACGGPDQLIVVLGQTREEPQNARSSAEFLRERGAKKTKLYDQQEIHESDRIALLDDLKTARGVWVPGGDQALFMDRWTPAWLQKNFPPALKRGVNFFGTSAGAMIMSNPMIAGPGTKKDTVEIRAGIGLLDALIDTHYRERSRQARLQNGIKQTKAERWIGLDAGEWIIVKDGEVIFVSGEPEIHGLKIRSKM